jgi:hypothetical protein
LLATFFTIIYKGERGLKRHELNGKKTPKIMGVPQGESNIRSGIVLLATFFTIIYKGERGLKRHELNGKKKHPK